MSWLHRRARALVALAGGVVMVAGGTGWGLAAAGAASPHRALVIVETGATKYARVITFTEDSVSGIRALELAGADPVVYTYAGQGGAVCRLFGVGRDASANCLGGADGDNRYWAYFRAPSGTSAFTYSRGGAGSVQVRDGDVEGWRFGTGQAPGYEALPPVTTTTTGVPTTTTTAARGDGPGGGGTGAGANPGETPPVDPPTAGGTGGSPTVDGRAAPAGAAATIADDVAPTEVAGRSATRAPGSAAAGVAAQVSSASAAPGASGSGSAAGTLVGFGIAIAVLVGLAFALQRGRGHTLRVE